MSLLHEYPSRREPAPLPGRRSGLIWAFALAPAYLFMSLSIMGGVPVPGEIWPWTFILALTVFAPVSVLLDVLAWRLRQRLGGPDWWTPTRHRNADKAIWMAAMVAFVLIPQSLIGWPAATHWAVCWLGMIPLIFLIGEVFDSAFGRMQDHSEDLWEAGRS